MDNNRDNLKVTFFTKYEKKDGTTPVYGRVYFGSDDTSSFQVGYSVPINKWNQKYNRVKGTGEQAYKINSKIEEIRIAVFDVYSQMINERDYPVNSRRVVERYLYPNEAERKRVNAPDLLDLFYTHLNEVKFLINVQYTYNTYKNIVGAYNQVKEFVNDHLKKMDIPLKDVDMEFMEKYQAYLRSSKGLKPNTVTKALKNLRKVLNIARDKELITKDLTKSFKIPDYISQPKYLTQDETDSIEQVKPSNKYLERTRDLFIFSCYTGIPYSDLMKLTYHHLKKRGDITWVEYYRGKTNIFSKVPLLEKAQRIIDKYRFHPWDKNGKRKGFLFPKVSNQKMNKGLKTLSEAAEIDRNVTFHMARHTFSTTITLGNDIPLEYLQAMLGHANSATTQIYGRIVDNKLGKLMGKVDSRYKRALGNSD